MGDVVALAEAFAKTLDEDQVEDLNQHYSFNNAAAWSNLPQALLTEASARGAPARIGLQTNSLSSEQWTALEDLLAHATGTEKNEGFDEIIQHLKADDHLADAGGGDVYGRGNYFVAFLGEPTKTGTWELQFGGHQLAVANTYTGGKLAGATPSFRGIESTSSARVETNTIVPEQQEHDAFAAMLASFDNDQLTDAKLAKPHNDILLGPGEDWAFPEKQKGLPVSELDANQKDLVLAAINTYVSDIDPNGAEPILGQYEDELNETYVAYTGDIAMETTGDYVRIDGPSVWIELSMQNGVVLQGAHPYAVWRDKTDDYGGLTP